MSTDLCSEGLTVQPANREAETALLALLRQGHLTADASGRVWRHSRWHAQKFIEEKQPRRADALVRKGYRVVRMQVQGTRHRVAAHRLNYLWFHGPIPDGYIVDHIDSDRLNNAPTNLQLLTPAQNHAKAAEAGRFRGASNGRAKLTVEDVRRIKQLRRNGIPGTELAKQYNVKPDTISAIYRGARWKHVK